MYKTAPARDHRAAATSDAPRGCDVHSKTPAGNDAAAFALKHALGTAALLHHRHGSAHDASSVCAAHPLIGAGAPSIVAVYSARRRRLVPPPMSPASRPVIRPTPDLACRALASASSMGYGPRFALTRSAYVGWSARANPASARSASARRSASVEQGRISK